MITEDLRFSDYEIIEKRQSLIDPDAEITERVGVKCPRCKTQLDFIDHGEFTICKKCRLEMIRYGNSLECSTK